MDSSKILETMVLWNFWRREINVGILREKYLKCIERYSSTDEVVVLTGVRRSGKSTILQQLLSELIRKKTPKENTLYINLEDPSFYPFLSVDLLDQIWQTYVDYLKPQGRVYLVLDEVQKIKGWESWVRAKYDRKENVKIFVTGSNAELLSSEFSTLLTGRHLEINVSPLNFEEFLKFKGVECEDDPLWHLEQKNALRNYAWEYLKVGGFPKIVLTEDEQVRSELLSQYFNDILIRDVAEKYKVKDVGKLRNLAIFYMTNFTRLYSFNKVKHVADFALSLDSVHRFSHYLENSFLIQFLKRFSYSLRNQMRAERKVFLVDHGLHHAVAFKFSEDKGKLLENAVFQHLKGEGKEVYYFSEKKEIDFICREGLKVTELINVCFTLESKETLLREVAGLVEGMEYFKLKQAKIIVAEGDRRELKEKTGKIDVIPFSEWAL
ncbi:MAG: ATP-binding protein [Chlamydiae bacterium]|nr:ATP-binding protein [Chlamydiota bacterium]MBI3277343.1 ATP-binding protein [Chlamydiota bacterium]